MDDPEEFLEDLIDIDDYITFMGKRQLRNILMNLRIEHHCSAKKKWAQEEAEKLWQANFEELLLASKKRDDIDEKIHVIKTRMVNQTPINGDTKSVQLEGGAKILTTHGSVGMPDVQSNSSWEAEGGAESEVNQSETRDQFFDDEKKLADTRRDSEAPIQ